jgi:hypothetical protein
MDMLFHPLAKPRPDPVYMPDVRYVGRCPLSGQERALRPTPQVIAEAERLKDYLAARRDADKGFSSRILHTASTGKMFGVLLCKSSTGELGTLRAFSGEWDDWQEPPGWVPSSGNLAEYSAQRQQTEADVAVLTRRIGELKTQPSTKAIRRAIEYIKIERGQLSRALTDQIHAAYRFENFLGEVLPLTEVATNGERPPTGTGDCCAPKLLQYAARSGLTPLGMVEFWWGTSSQVNPRVEGTYYSSCQHKCYAIMGFMLRGVAAAEVSP